MSKIPSITILESGNDKLLDKTATQKPKSAEEPRTSNISFSNLSNNLRVRRNNWDVHSMTRHSIDREFERPLTKSSNKIQSHYSDLFQIKGSIMSLVFVPTLLTGFWAAFWIIMMRVAGVTTFTIPGTLITLLNVVLGLLLVFRNNTAYDRYWEGRRLWAAMQKDLRNLARLVWVHFKAPTPQEMELKRGVMDLIYAFALSVKHDLRGADGFTPADLNAAVSHIPEILSKCEYEVAPVHAPTRILLFISAYVGKCRENDKCDAIVQSNCVAALGNLTDSVTSLERIRSSPIPKAYSVHMKQILLLYLLALPFQLAKDLIWATIPVVMFTTFALLGIEFISAEIENPFGRDANDLPVTLFCETIRKEVLEIMSRNDNFDPFNWRLETVMSPKSPRARDSIVVNLSQGEKKVVEQQNTSHVSTTASTITPEGEKN